MSLPEILHCDQCEEPRPHDLMPGNHIFPTQLMCRECHRGTEVLPTGRELDT